MMHARTAGPLLAVLRTSVAAAVILRDAEELQKRIVRPGGCGISTCWMASMFTTAFTAFSAA